MLSNKKVITFHLLIIFILGLVPLLWFTPGNIINGHDIGLPIKPIKNLVNDTLTSWDHYRGTGTDNSLFITYLIPYSLLALFEKMNFSLQLAEKLWFVFYFLFPGFTMYYMAYTLGKDFKIDNRICALVSSLFYMFNIYLITVWTGVFIATLSAYCIIPLLIAFFYKALYSERGVLKYSLLIGISSLFISPAGNNPPVLEVTFILLFIYFGIQIAGFLLKKDYLRLRRLAKVVILSSVIVVLINLWWILPLGKFLFQKSFGLDTAFNVTHWVEGPSSEASFFRVIRMLGNWSWYSGFGGEALNTYAHLYVSNPAFVAVTWLMPLLAFSALIFFRKREIWPFVFLAMAGSILAMGTHPPFKKLYAWLMLNIPGFWTLRSPWVKFVWLVAFAYAFLIGITVSKSYQLIKLKRKNLAYIFLFGFLIINMAFNYPLIRGKMFPQKKERKNLPYFHIQVPEYIFKAADWANKQAADFRIIQTPQQQGANYTWGYSSPLGLLRHVFNKPILTIPFEIVGQDATARIFNAFYKGLIFSFTQRACDILGIFNVRYILQEDDLRYDFFGGRESPQFMKERLEAQKGLNFKKRFGAFAFYEIDNYAPLVYTKEKLVVISGDYDSLIPLSLTDFINRRAFIFVDYQRPKDIFDVLKKTDTVIFYNTNLTDLCAGLLPAAQYSVVSAGKAADFKIKKSDKYDIWIQAKNVSREDMQDKITITASNDENFKTQLSEVKQCGLEWFNYGSLDLKPDNYKIVLENQQTTAEKVMVCHNRQFDDFLQELRSFLDTTSINQVYLFDPQSVMRVKENKALKIKVAELDKEQFYASEVWAQDEIWQWCKVGWSDIKLINSHEEALKTNCSFVIYTFKAKPFIIYLNGQIIKSLSSVTAGEPLEIVLDNMELQPGENKLSFYIPSLPDKIDDFKHNKDKRDVFFALKKDTFTFGPQLFEVNFQSAISVFKERPFEIDVFAYVPARGSEEVLLVEKMQMAVDEQNLKLKKIEEQSYSKFVNDNILLSEGRHVLSINSMGAAQDYFLLVVPQQSLFSAAGGDIKCNYQGISQTRYDIEIESENPFILVFNESYNPNWKLKIDEKTCIEPFLINGYANGFYVPQAINCRMSLVYAARKLYGASAIISAFSLMVFLILLVGSIKAKL